MALVPFVMRVAIGDKVKVVSDDPLLSVYKNATGMVHSVNDSWIRVKIPCERAMFFCNGRGTECFKSSLTFGGSHKGWCRTADNKKGGKLPYGLITLSKSDFVVVAVSEYMHPSEYQEDNICGIAEEESTSTEEPPPKRPRSHDLNKFANDYLNSKMERFKQDIRSSLSGIFSEVFMQECTDELMERALRDPIRNFSKNEGAFICQIKSDTNV